MADTQTFVPAQGRTSGAGPGCGPPATSTRGFPSWSDFRSVPFTVSAPNSCGCSPTPPGCLRTLVCWRNRKAKRLQKEAVELMRRRLAALPGRDPARQALVQPAGPAEQQLAPAGRRTSRSALSPGYFRRFPYAGPGEPGPGRLCSRPAGSSESRMILPGLAQPLPGVPPGRRRPPVAGPVPLSGRQRGRAGRDPAGGPARG